MKIYYHEGEKGNESLINIPTNRANDEMLAPLFSRHQSIIFLFSFFFFLSVRIVLSVTMFHLFTVVGETRSRIERNLKIRRPIQLNDPLGTAQREQNFCNVAFYKTHEQIELSRLYRGGR